MATRRGWGATGNGTMTEGAAEMTEAQSMRPERFAALWRSLSSIGHTDHGCMRYAWSDADIACREWFTEEATDRSLSVEADRNGNLYAWWGDPDADGAVLVGSHLDSAPPGGVFDGALGVVAGLLAIDLIRERGAKACRPIGIAAFAEDTGARFGVPSLGARLMTGSFEAADALRLRDGDGVRLSEALVGAGIDPQGLGSDPDRVSRIAAFIEPHVEPGRNLTARGTPVGVGTGIWPRGRWRLEFAGSGGHAGTMPMQGRGDPMLTLAFAVLAANKEARLRGARATVGHVRAHPNIANAIAATATASLDARARDDAGLESLLKAVIAKTTHRALRDATAFSVIMEMLHPRVTFDQALIDRMTATLPDAPQFDTAAGHTAGILATSVPSALLFVRNAAAVPYSTEERSPEWQGRYATDADCAAGVTALADVLTELAC